GPRRAAGAGDAPAPRAGPAGAAVWVVLSVRDPRPTGAGGPVGRVGPDRPNPGRGRDPTAARRRRRCCARAAAPAPPALPLAPVVRRGGAGAVRRQGWGRAAVRTASGRTGH